MKLLRVGPAGQERPALRGDDGRLFDLSGITPDIDGDFLDGDGLDRVRVAHEAAELPPLETGVLTASPPSPAHLRPGSTARIGPPVARIGKVVCIGLNYRDHAAETGAEAPPEPVVFMKATNTVVGPDDEVLVPKKSTRTDYEVELAVVLGRRARYLESPQQAREVIAGYAISNDVSEREFQLDRGGTWDKGKSCETFNPLGPWLVTADEIADPQNLALRLWVNGELRQDGHTRNMIFGVDHLVWYLSQFMVLDPGDIIDTGTPAGVAMGRSGDAYLRPGDVVELEIEGLGRQRQTVGKA